MHFFTIVLFLAYSAYSLQDEMSIATIRSICLEASEANPVNIEKAREGVYDENEEVAAYFYCAFLRLNMITFAAEKINQDEMISNLPIPDKEKVKPIVEGCIAGLKDISDKMPHQLYICFVKGLGPMKDFL